MLYKQKYRIDTTRLQHHDYSQPGWYFITLCTLNRIPWFGHIRNGIICVNDIGSVVANQWIKTEYIRDNVYLDQWIIMPDHFHGIIQIHSNHSVETHCNASLHHANTIKH